MRLNPARRTVLSVAMALALFVVGSWAEQPSNLADGGWFAYAPNVGQVFGQSTGWSEQHSLTRLGLWLALVAIWTAASWVLFANRSKVSDDNEG